MKRIIQEGVFKYGNCPKDSRAYEIILNNLNLIYLVYRSIRGSLHGLFVAVASLAVFKPTRETGSGQAGGRLRLLLVGIIVN